MDSSKFGQIAYRFVKDEVGATKYFYIDSVSGLIKTARTFDNVHDSDLPFRLIVEARDNPDAPEDESKTEEAHVVVSIVFRILKVIVRIYFFVFHQVAYLLYLQINLIEDRHRMILVINDARPDVVKNDEEKIIQVLEDHAKLIIGIEKIAPKQFRRSDNVTLESDPNSADLWFYAIDQNSELILERNSTRVTR